MKKRDRTARELPSIDDIILDYERMFADAYDPSTLVVQGTIFGSKGRFEDAIRYFDKAINIDPNFFRCLV